MVLAEDALTAGFYIGGIVVAVFTIMTALGTAAWWLYRRGRSSGTLRESVDRAIEAVQANTRASNQLGERFAAHAAKTDTRLDEHQRIIVQHDKRLSAGGL